MITPDEACEKTMEQVKRLEEAGVDVEVKPSKGRDIQETVAKYGNRPDRLPPEKWNLVTFKPKNDKDKELISEAAVSLAEQGICFDTGGCIGRRDWELDWSLHVAERPDNNMIQGREAVESALSQME